MRLYSFYLLLYHILPPEPKTSQFKPLVVAAFLMGGGLGYEARYYQQPVDLPQQHELAIQVRFSPGGACTKLVEETVGRAQQRVWVQAYSFTSLPIAEALIAAHGRGVDVRILVDRSQLGGKYSQLRAVMEHGIPVTVDKVPGIAHNKIMIVDEGHVLTGSFNWTNAAETRNAENLLLITDGTLNAVYAAKWQQRAEQGRTVGLEDLRRR